jgi:hypothetical protein
MTLTYISKEFNNSIETEASGSDELMEDLISEIEPDMEITSIDDFDLKLESVNGLEGYNFIEREFTSTNDIDVHLDMLNQINYSRDTEILDKLDHLLEHYHNNFDDAMYHLDDIIIYSNMDMTDIAEEYIDGCYDLEKMLGNLSRYFDYESFGEDLMSDGNYIEVGNDIYEYRG